MVLFQSNKGIGFKEGKERGLARGAIGESTDK
jgi:hypothetical protein